MPQVVTANWLSDGRVVWMTMEDWSGTVSQALLLETAEAAQVALARAAEDAKRNLVVEPYAIDVTVEDGRPIPVRLRERIRVGGPTTGNSTHGAPSGAA